MHSNGDESSELKSNNENDEKSAMKINATFKKRASFCSSDSDFEKLVDPSAEQVIKFSIKMVGRYQPPPKLGSQSTSKSDGNTSAASKDLETNIGSGVQSEAAIQAPHISKLPGESCFSIGSGSGLNRMTTVRRNFEEFEIEIK